MTNIIIIPARLAATRLPNKPILPIDGTPMIIHVWRKAIEADIGRVVVACGDQEIVDVVESYGGEAVLTPADLPSGSDRIYAALTMLDPDKKYDCVMNVQGDVPTVNPQDLIYLHQCHQRAGYPITTLAAQMPSEEGKEKPGYVKIALTLDPLQIGMARAHYFSRGPIPYGLDKWYHHIGVYAYQRQALAQFVGLPPSSLEQEEKLEQLRALEAGIPIGIGLVDSVPIGVDTAEDLKAAELYLQSGII